MTWQDNFTQYTTGFAFSLTLSRDQADLLEYLATGEWSGWQSHTGRNSFIPTFRGLERRGLAEHNPAAAHAVPGVTPKWIFRLTPAGKHVLELLRLSGVARPASQAEAAA